MPLRSLAAACLCYHVLLACWLTVTLVSALVCPCPVCDRILVTDIGCVHVELAQAYFLGQWWPVLRQDTTPRCLRDWLVVWAYATLAFAFLSLHVGLC